MASLLSGSDSYRNCNSTFPEHSKELEKKKITNYLPCRQVSKSQSTTCLPQAQTNSNKIQLSNRNRG
jgi:hypothetical protein